MTELVSKINPQNISSNIERILNFDIKNQQKKVITGDCTYNWVFALLFVLACPTLTILRYCIFLVIFLLWIGINALFERCYKNELTIVGIWKSLKGVFWAAAHLEVSDSLLVVAHPVLVHLDGFLHHHRHLLDFVYVGLQLLREGCDIIIRYEYV